MRLIALAGVFLSLGAASLLAQEPTPKTAGNAEKGREAVRGRPMMHSAMWTRNAFETVWKSWGLKEKPAQMDVAVRDRYGVHVAPYENDGVPMGFHVAAGAFGKGIVNDCMVCHSGAVAGQTILGLGNASLDLQALFDELPGQAGLSLGPPVRLSNVRGTIEAAATVAYLLDFRNADLTLRIPGKIKVPENNCQDVPAWWLMKKKKTMYHTGGGHSDSVRTMMPFLLSPFNSADHIKKLEPSFANIQAYIRSLEAPKYPFAIDKALAAQGEPIFLRNCAKCHGTYGADAAYPSKVVPLETIGTDPLLANCYDTDFIEHYSKSWFAEEKGRDGKPFPMQTIRGYQAPPLDGVWATAPYFHNGSTPTIYHVLNSKARPKIFTRSYKTEKDDYDQERVGLKVTTLERAPDAKTPGVERRKVYDTSAPGRGNGGHTFGDALTEEQRRALIEYLKTI